MSALYLRERKCVVTEYFLQPIWVVKNLWLKGGYLLFLSCSDCYGWLRLRLRLTICLSKVKVQRSKSHNEKTTGEIFACMQPCQTNKKNICQEKRSVRKIRQKHAWKGSYTFIWYLYLNLAPRKGLVLQCFMFTFLGRSKKVQKLVLCDAQALHSWHFCVSSKLWQFTWRWV